MSQLMFEVDGKILPADDCSWLLVAPCSCLCGITVIDRGEDVLATEDQAMKSFVSNAEQRRRDIRDGWTVRLGTRKDVHQLMDDCPHTPRWGVEATPIPEGYAWGRQVGFRVNRSRKHLVPVIGLENYRERRFKSGDTVALCGPSAWAWSDEWHELTDIPECVRCQRLARAACADADRPQPQEGS